MSNKIELILETTDGTKHEITALFADLIKYDVLRARYDFPKKEESEFLFMGLVAYAALVRTGDVKADVKPDAFLNTIAAIEPVGTEEDEEADG